MAIACNTNGNQWKLVLDANKYSFFQGFAFASFRLHAMLRSPSNDIVFLGTQKGNTLNPGHVLQDVAREGNFWKMISLSTTFGT